MTRIFGKSFATALTGAAFCLTAGLASAADLPPPPATKYVPPPAPVYKDAPPPVHAYDWSGPYIGAHIGYADGETDFFDGLNPAFDVDLDGWLGGGQIGYNFQAGSIVFGIEGDFSFADIDGNSVIAGGTQNWDVDWTATIRGRLGWAIDNLLIFATAGVGFLEMDTRASFAPPNNDSNTHTGFVIGGGLEWAFTQHWTFRAEYQYHDYDTKSYNVGGFPDTNEPTLHVVRAAINWKFW